MTSLNLFCSSLLSGAINVEYHCGSFVWSAGDKNNNKKVCSFTHIIPWSSKGKLNGILSGGGGGWGGVRMGWGEVTFLGSYFQDPA